LDNGQTDSLLAHLADSTYSNSTLISELQANGLLSDSVLLAVITRNPSFSDNSFTLLIVQNAPVCHKVWKRVLEKSADFKQENKDTLHYAQAYNTLRTVQQIKWEKHVAENKWYDAVGNILKNYAASDTTEEMHDTIFSFLVDTLGTKTFKKLAVGYGLEVGKVTESRTLLDSLNLLNAADSSFYNYYDLAVSLAEDTLTWFSMDSLQKAKLITIAADTIFDEHILAQSVLSLINDTTYIRTPEPMPGDTGLFKMAEQPPSTIPTEPVASNFFKVFPNPSENNFTFSYKLTEKCNLTVIVNDLQGRIVFSKRLAETETGELNIDLSPCNGMYILYVTNTLKQIYNHKLVCISR
jgi:hypothetical protein